MKITDVAVQLVQSDCGRKWTHVRVDTDEGVSGLGEATFSHKERVVAEMVNALKERVIGRDPSDTEHIYLDLYTSGRAGYRSGGAIFTSAIAGIDLALWDLKGKLLAAPVSALLGGPREATVPVYAHFRGETIEQRIEDAQRRLAEGFTAVKSSTVESIARGQRVTRDELRRIDRAYALLRSAVGEDVDLMDDLHAAFDAYSGLQIAQILEQYDLLFVEEPTIPEDHEGYARIRSGTRARIAGSERLTSKFRFSDFFRAGAVDVAQPDLVYVGGITEMKKIATAAELHQVSVAPHNTKGPVGIMAAAHLMAAIPNPLIQEIIAPAWVPWRNDVLREPLRIEDGAIHVPDRPGFGVEFDDEALAPHVVA